MELFSSLDGVKKKKFFLLFYSVNTIIFIGG